MTPARFYTSMKNQELSNQLLQSIRNYARMGIIIEILEMNDKEAKVRIEQKNVFNGYFLNQKQLVERVKTIFEHTGLKTKVYPLVYKVDLSIVSIEWIKSKMEEFGLKRKDLMRQLNIDKASLSLIFSHKVKLSIRTKTSFFYYFLSYELNRDLRGGLG